MTLRLGTPLRTYLLFVCLILLITLLAGRLPGGGYPWDFLNALGFCGLAALVYLGWDSDSPARGQALRLHSNLAMVAAILTGAHLLGLLVWDPTVLEYLKLKAPWYMHAGLVSFLCIVVLAATSFPAQRKSVYGRFSRFRGWHLGLSVAALGLALWHVLGAGFYAGAWYHQATLGVAVIGLPALAYYRRHTGQPQPSLTRAQPTVHADRQGALGLIAAVVLAGVYALLRNV